MFCKLDKTLIAGAILDFMVAFLFLEVVLFPHTAAPLLLSGCVIMSSAMKMRGIVKVVYGMEAYWQQHIRDITSL